MAILDSWSFAHFVGGFLLGILIFLFIPEEFWIIVIIGFPILFELFEQGIVTRIFDFVKRESFLNTIADIIITITGILIGLGFAIWV